MAPKSSPSAPLLKSTGMIGIDYGLTSTRPIQLNSVDAPDVSAACCKAIDALGRFGADNEEVLVQMMVTLARVIYPDFDSRDHLFQQGAAERCRELAAAVIANSPMPAGYAVGYTVIEDDDGSRHLHDAIPTDEDGQPMFDIWTYDRFGTEDAGRAALTQARQQDPDARMSLYALIKLPDTVSTHHESETHR